MGVKSYTVWPSECRQRGSTYGGSLIVGLSWSIDGISQPTLERDLGRIPIMIKVHNIQDYSIQLFSSTHYSLRRLEDFMYVIKETKFL